MAKKLWHSRFSHVLSRQSKSFFFFSVSVREIYPRLIACDVIMPALTTLTMSRISTTNFTCFRVLQSNEPKTIASILSKIAIGNGTKLKRARCSTIWMIQLCEESDTIASSIFSERNEKCRLRTFKLFLFFRSFFFRLSHLLSLRTDDVKRARECESAFSFVISILFVFFWQKWHFNVTKHLIKSIRKWSDHGAARISLTKIY